MRPLFALVFLLPTLALAQVPPISQLSDARGTAMGGAFRGLGIGADATLGNPAALAAVKAYQFELTGAWDPGVKEGFGALTVRDSQTTATAAGLDYHYLQLKDSSGQRHAAHLATLAIGFPIAEGVLLGVAGKYLKNSDAHVSAATVDTGLVIQPMEGLSLGLSGHNLVNTHHPELARYYSTQVGYTAGMFAAEFDVSGDPWRDGGLEPLYNVGLQYVLGSTYPLEAGFAADTLSGAKYVSGGIGVIAEGGGLDLAYRHQTNGDGRLLVLTFRITM